MNEVELNRDSHLENFYNEMSDYEFDDVIISHKGPNGENGLFFNAHFSTPQREFEIGPIFYKDYENLWSENLEEHLRKSAYYHVNAKRGFENDQRGLNERK